MTKPIVAMATMILVEGGQLRLDEPVDWLLPGSNLAAPW
jgi:CubicO group peptidase (beta-lactamase class C family)